MSSARFTRTARSRSQTASLRRESNTRRGRRFTVLLSATWPRACFDGERPRASRLIEASKGLNMSSHVLHKRRPRHIGIINDYVRIPYANGSSFASQFLYREFSKRGDDVTVLGPRDPMAREDELPRNAVLFDSVELKNHPGLFLAFPSRRALESASDLGLDVTLAQTGSGLLDLGLWLRQARGVPLLCVNTIHLPSVYNVVLPDALYRSAQLSGVLEQYAVPQIERMQSRAYNASDGLIVLSRGLERYWRERGVTVPIHVIPRAVNPIIVEKPDGP